MKGSYFYSFVILLVGFPFLCALGLLVEDEYKSGEVCGTDLKRLENSDTCFHSLGVKCKTFKHADSLTKLHSDQSITLEYPEFTLLSAAFNDVQLYNPFVPFISHYDDKTFDICFSYLEKISNFIPENLNEDKKLIENVEKISKGNLIKWLFSTDFIETSSEVTLTEAYKDMDSYQVEYCGKLSLENDEIIPFATVLFDITGKKRDNQILKIEQFMKHLGSWIDDNYILATHFIGNQLESIPDKNLQEIFPFSSGLIFYLLGGDEYFNVADFNKFITKYISKEFNGFNHLLDDEEECLSIQKRIKNFEEVSEEYGSIVKLLALSGIDIDFDEYDDDFLVLNPPVKWYNVKRAEYYVILLTFLEDILSENHKATEHIMKSILAKDPNFAKYKGKMYRGTFYEFVKKLSTGLASIDEKKSIIDYLMNTFRLQFDDKFSVALYAFKYFKKEDGDNDEYPLFFIIDEIVDRMSVNGLRGTFLNYGNRANGCRNEVQNGCIGELMNANEIVCERIGIYDEVINDIAKELKSEAPYLQFCDITNNSSTQVFDITNMDHYSILMKMNIFLLRRLTRKIYSSKLFNTKYIATNYIHRVTDVMEKEVKEVGKKFETNEDLATFSGYYKRKYSEEEMTDELHNSLLKAHLEDMIPTDLPPLGSEELNELAEILGLNNISDEGNVCGVNCYNIMKLLTSGRIFEVSVVNKLLRQHMIDSAKESKKKLKIPPNLGYFYSMYECEDETPLCRTTQENVSDYILYAGKIFLWRTLLNPGGKEFRQYCEPLCDQGALFLTANWSKGEQISDILCADSEAADIIEELPIVSEDGELSYPWSCRENIPGKKKFDMYTYEGYWSLTYLDSSRLKYLAHILLLNRSCDHSKNIQRIVSHYISKYPNYTNRVDEGEKEIIQYYVGLIASGYNVNDLVTEPRYWNITYDEKKNILAFNPSIGDEYLNSSAVSTFIRPLLSLSPLSTTQMLEVWRDFAFESKVGFINQAPEHIVNEVFNFHTLTKNEVGIQMLQLYKNQFSKIYLKALATLADKHILFDTILSGIEKVNDVCVNGPSSCFRNDWQPSEIFSYRFSIYPSLEASLWNAVKGDSEETTMDEFTRNQLYNGGGINDFLQRLKTSNIDLDALRLLAHNLIDDIDDHFDISGFKRYFPEYTLDFEELKRRLNLKDKFLRNAYWNNRLFPNRLAFLKGKNSNNQEKFFGYEICKSLLKFKDPVFPFKAFYLASDEEKASLLLKHGLILPSKFRDIYGKLSTSSLLMLVMKYFDNFPEYRNKFIADYEALVIPEEKFFEEYTAELEYPSFSSVPFIVRTEYDESVEYRGCMSTSKNLKYDLRMRFFFVDTLKNDPSLIQTGSIKFDCPEIDKNVFTIQQDINLESRMSSIPNVFVVPIFEENLDTYGGSISVAAGNIREDGFTIYITGAVNEISCEYFHIQYAAVSIPPVAPTVIRKGLHEGTRAALRFRIEIPFEHAWKEPENFKRDIEKWLESYNDENYNVKVEVYTTAYDNGILHIHGKLTTPTNDENDNFEKQLDVLKNFLKTFLIKDARCPRDWINYIKLPNKLALRDVEFGTKVAEDNSKLDVPCNEMIDSIESLQLEESVVHLGPFILYDASFKNKVMNKITKKKLAFGFESYTPITLTVETELSTFILESKPGVQIFQQSYSSLEEKNQSGRVHKSKINSFAKKSNVQQEKSNIVNVSPDAGLSPIGKFLISLAVIIPVIVAIVVVYCLCVRKSCAKRRNSV